MGLHFTAFEGFEIIRNVLFSVRCAKIREVKQTLLVRISCRYVPQKVLFITSLLSHFQRALTFHGSHKSVNMQVDDISMQFMILRSHYTCLHDRHETNNRSETRCGMKKNSFHVNEQVFVPLGSIY